MSSSLQPVPPRPVFDAAPFRPTLDGCRSDLATLRMPGHWTGPAGAERGADPDGRLDEIAGRLERAAAGLERLLEQAADAADTDLMRREADHRIKNSLQTVSAMLHRQAHGAATEDLRDALFTAAARVSAVGQVHAMLQAAPAAEGRGESGAIDLGRSLTRLLEALESAAGGAGPRSTLEVEVQGLAVTPSEARALGLAVTELATNALRHAFRPDRPGTVRITGARKGDVYELRVSDDGRGLPADFDLRLRPSGLGLRIVNRLVDQLRAKLTLEGGGGACFALTFPLSAGQMAV